MPYFFEDRQRAEWHYKDDPRSIIPYIDWCAFAFSIDQRDRSTYRVQRWLVPELIALTPEFIERIRASIDEANYLVLYLEEPTLDPMIKLVLPDAEPIGQIVNPNVLENKLGEPATHNLIWFSVFESVAN